MAKSPTFSTAIGVLVVALAAITLMLALARYDPGSQPGQVWRRGFLGGDQIRLLQDQRYQRQRWSCIGADETYESGSWAQVGDTVSLVPGSGSRPAYLMRMIAKDGGRYLAEASAAHGRNAYDTDLFERLR